MGSFVALLDSTVVNVALPAIRDDLGGGLQGQQWVVNAYLLFLGSLILIGGALGDVYGGGGGVCASGGAARAGCPGGWGGRAARGGPSCAPRGVGVRARPTPPLPAGA